MTQYSPLSASALWRFIRDEDGSATIQSLGFFMCCVVMGGLAIDYNKAVSEHTQLQIAADTAAHAAIYTRETQNEAQARQQALFVIEDMLPTGTFGLTPIATTDIEFGAWNSETKTFTAASGDRSAVQVKAEMTQDRGNPSRNLLLGIVGQDNFDIATEVVYSTYYPPCFTEGFVARGVVDIQSNNSFTSGFCIHSNSYVSLNNNNYFEPGTIVSMPNLDDLDMPSSGFTKNEGLQTALRSGKYRMRLLDRLPDMIDDLWHVTGDLPDYIWTNVPHDIDLKDPVSSPPGGGKVSKKNLTPYHFEPNAVNRFTCSGGGKITMDKGTYEDLILVTDCELKMSKDVFFENVVVATTSTSSRSINSSSGFTIGRDDNCAVGGGASFMTMGGVNVASKLSSFGGQIIANGDIEFAANANGIEGVSFIANGMIDGTSNMTMGFCDYEGMEAAYRAPYFRMLK